MARKAIVDKDVILSMLREGKTTQRIAERFNVSRQAVDIYRRDFIAKDLLPDQRAVRTRKASEKTVPHEQNLIIPNQAPPSKDIIPLDEQIDLIINAFNALKRLPQLEKEVKTYRKKYENTLLEIECLKKKEKKRLEQESRWLLTQRRSDAKPSS